MDLIKLLCLMSLVTFSSVNASSGGLRGEFSSPRRLTLDSTDPSFSETERPPAARLLSQTELKPQLKGSSKSKKKPVFKEGKKYLKVFASFSTERDSQSAVLKDEPVNCVGYLQQLLAANPSLPKHSCVENGLLGKGMFGVVYKVLNSVDQKERALKVSRISKSSPLANLVSEFDLVSKVDSPYIIKMEAKAEIKGSSNEVTHFVSLMELASQGDFNNVPIAENTWEEGGESYKYFSDSNIQAMLFYIKQMVLAHIAMRDNGFVSRDVKTENMVLHDNIIKYIDMGMAVTAGSVAGTWGGTEFFTDPAAIDKTKLLKAVESSKQRLAIVDEMAAEKAAAEKAQTKDYKPSKATPKEVGLVDLMRKDYKYDWTYDLYSLGMTIMFALTYENVYRVPKEFGRIPYNQVWAAHSNVGITFPFGTPRIFVYLVTWMLRMDPTKRITLEEALYLIHALGMDSAVIDREVIVKDGILFDPENPTDKGKEIPNIFVKKEVAIAEVQRLYPKDAKILKEQLYADLIGGANFQKIQASYEEKKNGPRKFLELVESEAVQFRPADPSAIDTKSLEEMLPAYVYRRILTEVSQPTSKGSAATTWVHLMAVVAAITLFAAAVVSLWLRKPLSKARGENLQVQMALEVPTAVPTLSAPIEI